MVKEIPYAVYLYGSKYNPDASCKFHTSYIGHSTEDCGLFKTRVQELMDYKILSFSEEGRNVRNNPLPNHNGQVLDAAIDGECSELVTSKDEYQD